MRSAALLGLLLALAVPALDVRGPAPEPAGGAAPVSTAYTSAALPTVDLPSVERLGTGVRLSGRERTFLLHVPGGLLAPPPLVVALHAYAQDAATMRGYSELERLADREGIVVAFAEGAAGSWAAGSCCGRARDRRVDDVAYLDAVIRTVQARTPVDPSRIAVVGNSNGAMMALRYACERSALVSSVAVVAGTLVAPCRPTAPVAVLDLHGADDQTVPLSGGTNARLRAVLPAVRPALRPFEAAGGDVEVRVVAGQGHGWLPDATASVGEWVRDHPRGG